MRKACPVERDIENGLMRSSLEVMLMGEELRVAPIDVSHSIRELIQNGCLSLVLIVSVWGESLG
jgi:hypothetical protein